MEAAAWKGVLEDLTTRETTASPAFLKVTVMAIDDVYKLQGEGDSGRAPILTTGCQQKFYAAHTVLDSGVHIVIVETQHARLRLGFQSIADQRERRTYRSVLSLTWNLHAGMYFGLVYDVCWYPYYWWCPPFDKMTTHPSDFREGKNRRRMMRTSRIIIQIVRG